VIATEVSTAVLAWWVGLGTIGVVGVICWAITATTFHRRRFTFDPALFNARRIQLALAAIYAFGCAYRGLLPRADVQRICLYDSWLSSVLVGRSVATVAEICFVIQWALLLREAAKNDRTTIASTTANLLVPMIVVAEICSWLAVVTTNFLGNVVEQSLWTLAVVLLTANLASLSRHYVGRMRTLMLAWAVGGLGFVVFMTNVDVPMYFQRWLEDEANGRQYLSLHRYLLLGGMEG
jgi:hypothetical protein